MNKSDLKNLIDDKDVTKLRDKYPKNLINVFVKLIDSKFDEKVYEKYKTEANEFLGKKADDPLEKCRLIIQLKEATKDLVEPNDEEKEEKKTNKAKKDKKPARSKRKTKRSRPDEE